MKTYIYLLPILLVLGLLFALPGTAGASGGGSWSASVPSDPDMEKAKIAIKEKNWDKAVELLNKAASRDPKNAEIQNELGFAERNRGNLDAAFKYYETALTLNPKHRGAHEYIGEAYLMAGNLPKAEEHLAKLDKLCLFPCEEYSDLKAAIAKYKQQHPN
jgi:tetratricopeptide (TPR) repeat protein